MSPYAYISYPWYHALAAVGFVDTADECELLETVMCKNWNFSALCHRSDYDGLLMEDGDRVDTMTVSL